MLQTGFKRIYDRLVYEARSLSGFLPAERRTMQELMEADRPYVPLRNGGVHTIDKAELHEACRVIPWYFRRLIKLPIVLRKEEGGDWYVVEGDLWDRRALELLLKGKLSSEGISTLSKDEVIVLMKKYRSLLMVTISLEFRDTAGMAYEEQ